MCQQVKTRQVDCPHVARDLYILKCPQDRCEQPCQYLLTGIPDWVWLETREEGKCHFCTLEEADVQEKDRGKRGALRRLDLERVKGSS
jgi:hypothetical protein